MGRVSLLLAVLAVLCGYALAQEDVEQPIPEMKLATLKLDKPTPLSEVLDNLHLDLGLSLTATKKLLSRQVGPVVLENVKWRKLLTWLAEQVDAEIVQRDVRWFELEYVPRVTFTLRDADLREVLRHIAAMSGKNIIIAPDVTGKVTVTMNRVPWMVALESIVTTLGFIAVHEKYDIIRIVKSEALKTQLVTEVFELKYLRPPDPYKAQFPTGGGGSGGGSGGSTITAEDIVTSQATGEEAFPALKLLRNVVTAGVGQIQYDPRNNTIIVTDTKPKLDEVRKILQELDKPAIQVRIDVKFIWTDSSNVFEKGFRWSSFSSEWSGPEISAWFPSGYADADAGGQYRFDLGRWESIRSGFKAIGVLDFTQARIALRLFEKDLNSQIVQQPTLMAIDSSPAVIFVGELVPYAKQEATTDQLGNVVITYSEADKSPVSIGFTLYVVPHVVAETNEVELTVIPKMSRLSGTTSPITGFERYGSGDRYIDLPRTDNQMLVTRMLLKNGTTAVVGGLLKKESREYETRVPVFGSIPLLGWLFRWRSKDTVTRNLIIFITPRIVSSSEDHVSLSEEKVRILKRVDYFYNRYRAGVGVELDRMLQREKELLLKEKRAKAKKKAGAKKSKPPADGQQ